MSIEKAKENFWISYRRFVDFVKGNFYEDPIAEEEDRDVWSGFEVRLDVLIKAARKLGAAEALDGPDPLGDALNSGDGSYRP